MELGFIPDSTYGALLQSRWHPGEAKQLKIFGMELPRIFGMAVSRNRGTNISEFVPITAYLCSGCGLLKFFANQESK
jgi:hypothetical protein